MDGFPRFQRWRLERCLAALRQRYPASRLMIEEDSLKRVVIQLDRFSVTITRQGMVEVSAPTNAHQRVEQLASEIEQILRQASPPGQAAQ